MERVVRDRRVSVEVRERFMLRGVRDKKRWDVDGGTGHDPQSKTTEIGLPAWAPIETELESHLSVVLF